MHAPKSVHPSIICAKRVPDRPLQLTTTKAFACASYSILTYIAGYSQHDRVALKLPMSVKNIGHAISPTSSASTRSADFKWRFIPDHIFLAIFDVPMGRSSLLI